MNILHYVASAYIFSDDLRYILFVYHHKLQCWLPPGGHVEPNELPTETVLREINEETGLSARIVNMNNQKVLGAISETNEWTEISRPFALILERIPSYLNEPEHYHLDFIYVVDVSDKNIDDSNKRYNWFPLKSIDELSTRSNVKRIIKSLLSCLKSFNWKE
jgi:8-oxo-dGTP pyrophosphatase MutT (NUDIX family)